MSKVKLNKYGMPKNPGTYYYYSKSHDRVYAFYIFELDGSHGSLVWEPDMRFYKTPAEAEKDAKEYRKKICD